MKNRERYRFIWFSYELDPCFVELRDELNYRQQIISRMHIIGLHAMYSYREIDQQSYMMIPVILTLFRLHVLQNVGQNCLSSSTFLKSDQ